MGIGHALSEGWEQVSRCTQLPCKRHFAWLAVATGSASQAYDASGSASQAGRKHAHHPHSTSSWSLKRSAKPSPLNPAVPVQVHPHVITSDDLFTLRLPRPAAAHTLESFRNSDDLAIRFSCYLPTATTGKTYVYADVNPDFMQGGALPDPTDREFLQRQCTKILRQDGIITRSSLKAGYIYPHGPFPDIAANSL
jgi:hypothetical protein